MKTQTRKTDSPRNAQMRESIDRAFRHIREMVEHPDKWPNESVLLTPEQASEIFTKERARMMRALQEHQTIDSVSELADLLDRDVTRVSRDLNLLVSAGLARVERDGKAKRIRAQARPILIAI
jgi:predicted transcriptional regulator